MLTTYTTTKALPAVHTFRPSKAPPTHTQCQIPTVTLLTIPQRQFDRLFPVQCNVLSIKVSYRFSKEPCASCQTVNRNEPSFGLGNLLMQICDLIAYGDRNADRHRCSNQPDTRNQSKPLFTYATIPFPSFQSLYLSSPFPTVQLSTSHRFAKIV